MNADSQVKSNSFRATLLELIIIIGIFAIVSVYLLRMFVVADKMQNKAEATTMALVRAESVAEAIRATEPKELEKMLAERFKLVTETNGDFAAYYDDNWERTDEKSAFTLIFHLEPAKDGAAEGYVKVISADEEVEYCRLKFVVRAED